MTMRVTLLIVSFIATTLRRVVADDAKNTMDVAEEENEIVIVADDTNKTKIIAQGSNKIVIETMGADEIKIVVPDEKPESDKPSTRSCKVSPKPRTRSPRTYQYTTTQKVDIFQNYGYPKPKDVPILNRKIFKGARVTIREHPYIVSIRRLYSHYIPGSLLSENLILTVAHPLHGVSTGELGVVAGENYSDRGTAILSVVFVVIHQDFDPNVLANDIAILRTYNEFFHFTNVKAIKLHSTRPPLGAQAFVTGWGRCDFTGKELCLPRSNMYYPREVLDPMLRTVTFTITNNSYCNEYTKNEVPLRPGMMCMGTSRFEEYMTSCLAVPGAPQVVHGRLTGILSWGLGCGYTFDMPLVYVDLFYYRKWLIQNMEVLLNIPKEEISVFNLATEAYVMQQWLNRTKKSLRQTDGDEHDLQTFDVDIELAYINGIVYDIRDFLYNGKYHKQKQKLYARIKESRTQTISVNYSYPVMPFLNKHRFQKLGIHIRQDGTISEEDFY